MFLVNVISLIFLGKSLISLCFFSDYLGELKPCIRKVSLSSNSCVSGKHTIKKANRSKHLEFVYCKA